MTKTHCGVLLGIALGLASCATAPSDIYRRVVASAVVLRTRTGSGSGTVIWSAPDGALVLTAYHVVAASARDVRVVAAGDEGLEAAARVVAAAPAQDLAIVSTVSALGVPALPIAATAPEVYDALFVVAAPLGLPGTAAPAVLSSKALRGGAGALWQITSFVLFGSSGGTVVNTRGELVAVPVGVATWGQVPVPQVGLCVGLETIRAFLARVASEQEGAL